jgi:hypothetical protein
MKCIVEKCEQDAVEVVDLGTETGPGLEFAVCSDHALDLRAGATYELRDRVLLMGDDLPLELVDWSAESNLGGITFHLKLGRGPQVQQEVSFRARDGFRFGYEDDFTG